MSFFFLSFSFKLTEREREWYIKLGIRRNSPKVTYLIFSTGFHWRIFVLLRVKRLYAIFNTGLKKMASSSSFTRSTWLLVLSPTNPVQRFSYYLFPLTGRSPHFRFGVSANHLASIFFPLVRRFF